MTHLEREKQCLPQYNSPGSRLHCQISRQLLWCPRFSVVQKVLGCLVALASTNTYQLQGNIKINVRNLKAYLILKLFVTTHFKHHKYFRANCSYIVYFL